MLIQKEGYFYKKVDYMVFMRLYSFYANILHFKHILSGG